MNSYITLLRALNVGGRNKMSSSELQSLFASCGSVAIKTYIQSGNVLHQSLAAAQSINQMVQAALSAQFHYDLHVFTLTIDTLNSIINGATLQGIEDAKVYVTLFEQPISALQIEKLMKYKTPQEQVVVTPYALYLHHAQGYSQSQFTNKK